MGIGKISWKLQELSEDQEFPWKLQAQAIQDVDEDEDFEKPEEVDDVERRTLRYGLNASQVPPTTEEISSS